MSTIFRQFTNVVVAGVPDNFWGENVAAALVLEEGAAFDEDEFRTRLSSKLARFKIPRYFCIYDAFPMLPNGKVDMVALRRDLEDKTRSE